MAVLQAGLAARQRRGGRSDVRSPPSRDVFKTAPSHQPATEAYRKTPTPVPEFEPASLLSDSLGPGAVAAACWEASEHRRNQLANETRSAAVCTPRPPHPAPANSLATYSRRPRTARTLASRRRCQVARDVAPAAGATTGHES